MQAVKGISMEKWLCWGSMGVSGLLLLLFLIDIFLKIPFGGVSIVVNILGILRRLLYRASGPWRMIPQRRRRGARAADPSFVGATWMLQVETMVPLETP